MFFLKKVFITLSKRPTRVWQYSRGLLLFFLTKILSPLALHGQNIKLGQNVRFQSLSNFLTADNSANIQIGDHSIIYENARLESYGSGSIEIAERAVLGDVRIISRNKITIGKRALMSWNVFIQDFDPHPTQSSLRSQQMIQMTENFFPRWDQHQPQKIELDWTAPSKPILIGDDCWIGANVTILKGVEIGNGCIVAAGSVVTSGKFADNSLIAGNPAKFVKELKS